MNPEEAEREPGTEEQESSASPGRYPEIRPPLPEVEGGAPQQSAPPPPGDSPEAAAPRVLSYDPSEVVLSCTNLHKYLGSGAGRVHVLRGVSLELYPGGIYSIVGPSGCGKSTLMYLLGLLDRPDDGKILLRGEAMDSVSDEARTRARNEHIGFVFQFHFLLAEFTALENLMLPMRKLGRWSEKEMAERALSLLEEVGLGDKTHRLANQLSGGEQQRVAVARALSNEPSVIFADEPTGNLDVKNSTMVFQLLQRLSREHGQAILMVTHNPNLAKKCDVTLSMMDGEFTSAS